MRLVCYLLNPKSNRNLYNLETGDKSDSNSAFGPADGARAPLFNKDKIWGQV